MDGALRPKPGRNDRCPCDSGKKYKKCCGQDGSTAHRNRSSAHGAARLPHDNAEAHFNTGNALQRLGQLDGAAHSYRRALELKPDFTEAHINLGGALSGMGRLDDAAASFERALAIRPDAELAHNNLGTVQRRLGRLDEAVSSCRRALEIKPNFLEACNNLGNALQDLGRLDEAMDSFHRALALNPDLAEVHNNVGNCRLALGKLDDATTSYRRAVALKPQYAEAHNNLGIALRRQGHSAEALISCRTALQIDPRSAAATTFFAELHADQGRFAEAEELFKRAIAIEPDSPTAWAGIAGLRRMTLEDAVWLTQAERIAERAVQPRQEANLRYAIGKYFDDVGDFERAFLNYRRANELTKLYSRYDRTALSHAIDATIQTYDGPWLSRAPINAAKSPRPVFIIGMPRSGTTLAEQILAAHPAVFGAGELPFWNAASATYVESTLGGDSGGSIMGKLAEDYLRLLEDLSPGALRVVDKMPGNYLFLGLIHAVLPNARIIHMRRDPLDTCLSIYFQNFDATHTYANDLDDLAHYYTEYLRVMKHWQSILPEDAILEVPYEALVRDLEMWSRKMLEFIGLPWDPACLDFHMNDRSVSTFSKWQVRQRINRSTVERWRNYRKFVGPLLRLN